MTVNCYNVIEGHVVCDMSEGKEKISVTFTQKYFHENSSVDEEKGHWILRFDKHKSYSIDHINKSYKESDNKQTLNNMMKDSFNLDREEKSVFYKTEISPGKIACFSRLKEEHDCIMRIKDEHNAVTSMEIRSSDIFIHVEFSPSDGEVNSDLFDIPEGYKEVK